MAELNLHVGTDPELALGSDAVEFRIAGTSDYEQLENKPSIGGRTLSGDLPVADLKEMLGLGESDGSEDSGGSGSGGSGEEDPGEDFDGKQLIDDLFDDTSGEDQDDEGEDFDGKQLIDDLFGD